MPLPTAIGAIVFDLDGVLIDSEGRWDEVRRSIAADAGRPWPAEATRAMQGMSTAEWSSYLARTVGIPGDAAELANQVIDRIAAGYRRDLPLLPGAVEAVRRLNARWPLGLASSSPRRVIDQVLKSARLSANFAVTVSTEEVEAGKPSPAVYLTAAGRLEVDPSQVVAIEDSSNGLRSAAAAGMIVLAIPHASFPPAPDALALARGQVARLDDVTVDLIESLA